MKKYNFKAEIKKHKDKDATYIEVPLDVEKEFGSKRVKVRVKFDNIDYRGSIVKMGLPCYMIGITKEIRNKIGKSYGDIISVEIEKDEDERIVELPKEFKEKLIKNNDAYKFYESLSYSQKRKYFQWITSAKKEETKIKRQEEAIEKLELNIKI
ncbi:YdeI/OmpD-associated family protein [Clostridium nigeriense]|uniref:YdeI/OmpD-associated family protein n=1 Tax=Clostridium nigeriense TaxID=1805470 RepID=UPI00082B87D6|nr:YdeI/OmpD-associated family protein [Clostridium nigeriense]